MPLEIPILVDLSLDRDGILQVTAKEKKTGLQQRIVIDKALGRLDEDDLAEARRRIGGFLSSCRRRTKGPNRSVTSSCRSTSRA